MVAIGLHAPTDLSADVPAHGAHRVALCPDAAPSSPAAAVLRLADGEHRRRGAHARRPCAHRRAHPRGGGDALALQPAHAGGAHDDAAAFSPPDDRRRRAGREDPDSAAIGGDTAYVNALLAGNETWNRWLALWDEHTVTTDGRMIPIVTAIGNHEINQFRSGAHEVRSPWYMSLFGRQSERVHHVKRFGNLLAILVLDSGHLVPHEAQVEWLRETFDTDSDVRYTFAAYHVPLYPAHRDCRPAGRSRAANTGCPSSTSSDHVWPRAPRPRVQAHETAFQGRGRHGRHDRPVHHALASRGGACGLGSRPELRPLITLSSSRGRRMPPAYGAGTIKEEPAACSSLLLRDLFQGARLVRRAFAALVGFNQILRVVV